MDLETWRELNRQRRIKRPIHSHACPIRGDSGSGGFSCGRHTPGGPARLRYGRGDDAAWRRRDRFHKGVSCRARTRSPRRGTGARQLTSIGRKTENRADQLIDETLADPGVVEVGYHDGLRFAITLTEQTAKDGNPGMVLDANTVFVVTGAAGGITTAIVADLAVRQAARSTCSIWCRARRPMTIIFALFRTDGALKLTLIEQHEQAAKNRLPCKSTSNRWRSSAARPRFARSTKWSRRAAAPTTGPSICATRRASWPT